MSGLGVGLCKQVEHVNHVTGGGGETRWEQRWVARRLGRRHTFHKDLWRRTARCSLGRGREMEEGASEEEAGSEWQERASKEELREDARGEEGASGAWMVKTRRSASMTLRATRGTWSDDVFRVTGSIGAESPVGCRLSWRTRSSMRLGTLTTPAARYDAFQGKAEAYLVWA